MLVGGEGTRLRPLTYDVPKPMLPVVERPMIARIVEWLGGHGVTDAVFSLGYRPDAFLDAFPDGSWAGVRLHYAIEPERLDTAGAILFGARATGLGDEAFLVVNGDILTDLDLDQLVATHRLRGGVATIALTPVEDPSAYGVVPTDTDGRVLAFIEKPPPGQAPTNLVNAGTYVLEPAALDRIPSGRKVSIEREVFPALVEDGVLYAMASKAYWLDTGTPERYLQAQSDVLCGARPGVVFPDCVEQEPGVRLAPGAVLAGLATSAAFLGCESWVGEGAEISEAVIGAGSVVEPGASVDGSVLLPGAVVREGARVERSVIGPGAVIGHGALVAGYSILGARVEIEAGAVLDSARVPV